MSSTTVRSVTVRMDAHVAKYIADMRRAGRETDKAFGSAGGNLRGMNRELDQASPRLQRSERELQGVSRATFEVDRGLTGVRRSSRDASKEIDQLSGRVRLLRQGLAVLGPATIPLTSVVAPALTTVATAATGGVLAVGSLITAFHGVADAVSALDDYQADPTLANLAKSQDALRQLGPDARAFVAAFDGFQPTLTMLRDSAAAGWFPGLIESLEHGEDLAPKVARLLEHVSEAGAQAVADGAESLASPRWADFWRMLDEEMPGVITDTGKLVGDFTHGLTEMWESAVPTNQAGMEWLTGLADTFDRWASSDKGRADVQAFLDYATEHAPLVRDFFVETTDALVQMVQAAEPLSGPVLETLTKLVTILGAVADSDLGTPIFAGMAALSVYNRSLAVTSRLQQSVFGQAAAGQLAAGGGLQGVFGRQVAGMKAGIPTAREYGTVVYRAGQSTRYASAETLAARRSVGQFSRAATMATAPLAGLALATTDLNDSVGASNSEMGAMIGTLGGPLGIALGATIGTIQDITDANADLETAIAAVQDAAATGDIDGLREGLRSLREEQDAWQASVDDYRSPSEWLDDFSKIPRNPVDWLKGAWNEFIVNSDDAAEAAREVGKSALEWQRGFNATPAATHVETFTAVFNELEGQIDDTARATRGLSGELAGALGFLDKYGATTAYAAAIDDVTDSIKDNGKSLDENTRKGQANRDALEAFARAGLQMYDQIDGKAAKTRFMDELREDARKALKQFELGNHEIRKYLEDLELVDKKEITPEIDVDVSDPRRQVKQVEQMLDALGLTVADPAVALEVGKFHAGEQNVRALLMNLARITADPHVIAVIRDALNGIGTVRGALASLHDKDVTVTVRTRHVGGSGSRVGDITTESARGNLFPGGPGGPGDVANGHQPMIGRHMRVWGEPETGGEAYIPLANDSRRPRARGILEETAALLGGDVAWYARGGLRGADADAADTSGDGRKRHRSLTYLEGEVRSTSYAFQQVRSQLKATEKQLKISEKTLDRESDARRGLQNEKNTLRGEAVSSLRDDLFAGAGTDIWAAGGRGGAPDILGTLRDNTAEGRAYQMAIARLERNGVNGAALAEANSLEKAQALLALGQDGLRRYQRLYDVRQRVTGAAGEAIGAAVFGEKIDVQTQVVRELRDEVREIRAEARQRERRMEIAERKRDAARERAADRRAERNAKSVGKVINGAAAKSHRDKRPPGIGGGR